MAISQVSRGVYVVSPSKVDTSGGKYALLFTKSREEQWQLAQKQASMEADVASSTFTEQMKVYRDRLDGMNDQARDLAKMRDRLESGELTALDRAELESWRLQSARDVKLKERSTLSAPGTTTTSRTGSSESTRTGTGGGSGVSRRGGGGIGSVSAKDAEQLNAALAKSAGDPAVAAAAVRASRQSKVLGASTPEDTDAQNYKVVNDLADIRAARTGEDISTATDNVLLELSKTDAQYAASHARIEAASPDAPGGGGTGPTSSRSGGTSSSTSVTTRTGGQYRVEKHPGLGGLQEGPEIPVEDRQGLIDDLERRRLALEQQAADLRMPEFEGTDYITRAREIAAGRFGPTSQSPAYGQRNALQALLGADPAMRTAIMERYRASTPTPVVTPVPRPALPSALTPSAPSDVAASAGSPPPLVADLPMDGMRPKSIPRSGDLTTADAAEQPQIAPVPGDSVAHVTPQVAAPSVPDSTAVRPEAAALMTPGELASAREEMRRRLEERAALQQLLSEQGTALRAARETQFAPPSPLSRMAASAMAAPQLSAVGADLSFTPRAAAASVPSIGSRPLGPDAAVAAEESPSRQTMERSGPMEAPAPRRPLPLGGTTPATRTADSTVDAAKRMDDIRVAGAGDAFRGPQGAGTKGAETKEGYLFSRLQSAYLMSKQPSKLERITASGSGKVAYDLYVANRAKSLPFSKTYEEITMTFSGDRKAMEQAHAAALALDIRDSDKTPGGK